VGEASRLGNLRLFLGNFDFEHHLGANVPRVLPAQIQRLNDEMASCLVSLAQADDCVWAPELPEPTLAQHLEAIGLPRLRFVNRAEEVPAGAALVPWGCSITVRKWAQERGWACDCPDPGAVAKANSREFSSGLEAEWDIGLPGARTIRTEAQLDLAFADAATFPAGWVIKANFGMSARERIVSRSATPNAQHLAWARGRLRRGEPLFLEPWVQAVAEFGCQFTVPASGPPALVGITGLLTDSQGTYRGSRLFGDGNQSASESLSPSVLEVVDRAAKRIQQLGYFGPLGIDVMQYHSGDGELRWRPLQDINARLTMGRVALGLRRLLQPAEQADWLHLRPLNAGEAGETLGFSEAAFGSGVRVVRTSPLELGGSPCSHQTGLVIARSTQTLDKVIATIQTVHARHRRSYN
jgi:hypothetical protein